MTASEIAAKAIVLQMVEAAALAAGMTRDDAHALALECGGNPDAARRVLAIPTA